MQRLPNPDSGPKAAQLAALEEKRAADAQREAAIAAKAAEADTLADQLGRAMAAVAVGSDDLEQIAAEEHRAEHSHDVDPEYLERNGLLGGGGYASVWLATDTRTGRQRH